MFVSVVVVFVVLVPVAVVVVDFRPGRILIYFSGGDAELLNRIPVIPIQTLTRDLAPIPDAPPFAARTSFCSTSSSTPASTSGLWMGKEAAYSGSKGQSGADTRSR